MILIHNALKLNHQFLFYIDLTDRNPKFLKFKLKNLLLLKLTFQNTSFIS